MNNGTSWTTLSTGILRDGDSRWGNYTWIPTVEPSTQCKIKIVVTSGTSQDISDHTFSIINPDPSIASSPTPADNATDQGYRPTLSWTGSGTGTVKYDVYFY